MANKTLCQFSAPTTENIRTGPQVNVGEDGFELKPALITMVQASQFCGKAHEDASAHLQYFLEICSTFRIKGVTRNAILLCLFPFSLLGKAKQWFYVNKESHYMGPLLDCFPIQVIFYRQDQCSAWENCKLSATT
jgi:hypothetical protein